MRGIRKDVRDLKDKLNPTPIITPEIPDLDWGKVFERYGNVILKEYARAPSPSLTYSLSKNKKHTHTFPSKNSHSKFIMRECEI